jgi:hypothetical protein
VINLDTKPHKIDNQRTIQISFYLSIMHNPNQKAIVVTIQENNSHYYEYSAKKLLHNSTVDNDGIADYQEAKAAHNLSASSGGVVIDGNENNWKGEMNKDHLEHVFIYLKALLAEGSTLQNMDTILIFFSSNTSKHDLEKAIEDFKDEHHKVNIEIINKNIHGHEMIEKAAHEYFGN